MADYGENDRLDRRLGNNFLAEMVTLKESWNSPLYDQSD